MLDYGADVVKHDLVSVLRVFESLKNLEGGACLLSGVRNKINMHCPGPSCSKLTTSLVNDSLKFTSSDMQIY